MPRKLDIFDPRAFQLVAQVHGIYCSLAGKYHGTDLSRDRVRELISRAFAMGHGAARHVPKPKKVKGTAFSIGESSWVVDKELTPRTIRASAQRYAGTYEGRDLTDLIYTRQGYEEMLALPRKDFYRPVAEITTSGVRYFVWPLVPELNVPVAESTPEKAIQMAKYLSQHYDPRKTVVWWQGPNKRLTKSDLRAWLPPQSVFVSGELRIPTRSRKTA